jgi:hypothetical protein
MLRSRALVIPLLAFVILLLVAGIAPAHAEEGDGSGAGGDAVPSEEADNAALRTGIDVTQTCTATAAIGDTVTYVVTVINTGEEPLKGIKVAGSLLGDIGDAFSDNLDVGGQEARTFSHVVTASDPDPLESVVTAKTEGAITDESENDTATCVTDIIPAQAAQPGIEVAKSCPATGTVGNVITYTIRVTNTGDEEVGDLRITDSVLGDLSDEFPGALSPGQSEERAVSRTLVQGDVGTLVNEVAVLGSGVSSGIEVSDAASCQTAVQAVLPTRFLPRTGVSLPGLAATGFGFLMLGTALVVRSYRGPLLAPIGGVGRRLAGRSQWTWGPPPSWRILAILRPDRGRWITQARAIRRSGFRDASRRTEPSGE